MERILSLFASPIQKAVQSNNLSKLREAVQRYPNLDEQESEHGNTALMIAARAGYDACCRELLARGADVCLRNKEGKTALHLAVSGGHLEVVRALMRRQPDKQMSITDKAGKTPQEYCQPEHASVAALLCPHGPPFTTRSLTTTSSPTMPSPTSLPPQPAAAAVSQQQPLPSPQVHVAPAFPIVQVSPFHSVYPPNPEAAYDYILRPPALSPSGLQPGCASTPPASGSTPQLSAQPPSSPHPSIPQPATPHTPPPRPAAAAELHRQMAQLGVGSCLQQQQPAQLATVTPSPPVLGRVYSKQELDQATQSFSPLYKIGVGGFGAVYRGMLDGIRVAIKVMDGSPDAMQGLREFTQEMNILSRVHHPHIVLLIGVCLDSSMPSLVYELAEGGSLEDHMFKPGASSAPLSWEDRVRIAAEVASALLFLHSSQPPVAHMDIKPANILLSRSLTAKLGDVGLSRILKRPAHLPPGAQAPSSAQASHLVGTPTYVDPEYMRTGEFSTKSDIYALGMVMLQLVTGQDKGSVVPLVEHARLDPSRFSAAIDPNIRQSCPVTEAITFADLALQCLEFRRKDRPDLRTAILPTLVQLRDNTASQDARRKSGLPALMPGGPSIAVPVQFVCPITQEVMRCPVVAADGHTYEKSAIESWIQRSATSPLTNLSLPHTGLTPNHNLRSALCDWLQQRP